MALQSSTLYDLGPVGEKIWTFNTSGQFQGLVSRYQGYDRALGRTLQQVDTTWSVGTAGQSGGTYGPYISSTSTTMDPAVNAAVKRVDQTLDQWGNVTLMNVYEINNTSTPRRVYTNTYLADSNHAAVYIRNRLMQSTVKEWNGPLTTLVSNTYDAYNPGAIVNVVNMREFDYT